MSENNKNNEIVISVSSNQTESTNNDTTKVKIESSDLILMNLLFVMLSISYYYFCCKLQGNEEEFWDFVEQFNQFCKKHAWGVVTELFYLFMCGFGISLVKKSWAFNEAKQRKDSSLSTTAAIAKSLQQQPIIEKLSNERKKEEINKQEIDEILKPLSFLTILRDYEKKTLRIGFGKQKIFALVPKAVGIESLYNVSLSVAEFFENILRDIDEKKMRINCEYVDDFLNVIFLDDAQLNQFVALVLNVIKVIVESELTLLECRQAIQGFNKDECNKRLAKINNDLKVYSKQQVANLYYNKKEKVIKKYIDNIRQIKFRVKELSDKHGEIDAILLRTPSTSKEVFLVDRYQVSIFKVEKTLQGLAKQYQDLENDQRRFLKNAQEINQNTIEELMAEEQVSKQMGNS